MQIPISHIYMIMTTMLLKPLFLNYNTTRTMRTTSTDEEQPPVLVKIREESRDTSRTVQKAPLLSHEVCLLDQNTSLMDHSGSPPAEMHQDIFSIERETKYEAEEIYILCFLNLLSLIIIPGIRVLRDNLKPTDKRGATPDEDRPIATESASLILLDTKLLGNFCEKFICASGRESCKIRDFVGGFADDLLDSLRSVCSRETGIKVMDGVGVGSMFEQWRVTRPLKCDLIVPFDPPEAYGFQCKLWCTPPANIPPEAHGCGQILIEKIDRNTMRCLCSTADAQDEVLCLLHGENRSSFTDDYLYELLCSKDAPGLSKRRVMSWFQLSMTRAWERISHRYNFELILLSLESSGDVKVRFRSKKTISFNIIPAIRYKDTDAYFVPNLNSDTSDSFGTYWYLSFAVYEGNLLKLLTSSLPENSCHSRCLQILSFMHMKQTQLTGETALSTYHFKTTLLHLLLDRQPMDWRIDQLNHRLRDVLVFMERSIKEKTLYHIFIGNPQIPRDFVMPQIFRSAEPVNLFHPLSLEEQSYNEVLEHFEELVRNVPVIIQDYAAHSSNGKQWNISETVEAKVSPIQDKC